MKKLLPGFLLCFCFFVTYGQSKAIVLGKIDSLHSKALNEQRDIWVYVPEDTSDSTEEKRYPVVYLLDGSFNFYSVVGIIRQLSSVNGNSIIPKMMVVGIPNTNRTRDLTPTKSKPSPPFVDQKMADISGGGPNFMSFLEKELIPYIDANYPTEPYRMFIGHSFGGLTVVNTLVNQPELFNAFVAIDPSMWWDNKKLLEQMKQSSFGKKYHRKSLFLGIANTMSPGMDTLNVQKDTTVASMHIRAILEMNTLLKKNADKQLSFDSRYYPRETHGSVPLMAEYDALRSIFGFYQLKLSIEDYLDPESDIFDKVVNHYKRLSEEFGKEMKPEEDYVMNRGYQFMRLKQYKRAEQFFQLNAANYPESPRVYNALGDLHKTTGNTEKAIENYKKSVSIDEGSNAKEKLEGLQKE